MAHYHFNQSTEYGAPLRTALNLCESADFQLKKERNLMVALLTGDSADEASYTDITAKFGFDSDAESKAAFGAIDTAYQALAGIQTGRDQLYASLG